MPTPFGIRRPFRGWAASQKTKIGRMTKWTKTRRDPGRTYCDPEEAAKLRRDVQRVQELVRQGLDAEPEYVELINKLDPKMTSEKRKELIKQFRDAVYDQQPDLPGR